MPIYEFKCPDGHLSERQLPMTSETRQLDCPECGVTATRIISAPAVRRTDGKVARAVDAAQKSAYEPTVVNSLPSSGNRRATPVSHNPQHAKLPKP